MNRRDFIKHSLLAAGSLAATRALGAIGFYSLKFKQS